jgi:Methylase involved in ubiquinone/menaquinone biosynthesis
MGGKNKSLFQKLTEEFIWLDSKYSHSPYHKRLIKEIFSPALDKEDKIINIGCGAGGLSRKLAQVVNEGKVVGIDISEGYIKKLNRSKERAKLGDYKSLVFVLASAEDIPYPDNYFDRTVVSESFGFWSEPEKGLKEIKRTLKPGGKLYIINSYKGAQVWVRISVKVFNSISASGEKPYTSQEYREFFERAGFTVVEQKEVMGSPLVTIGTKREGESC